MIRLCRSAVNWWAKARHLVCVDDRNARNAAFAPLPPTGGNFQITPPPGIMELKNLFYAQEAGVPEDPEKLTRRRGPGSGKPPPPIVLTGDRPTDLAPVPASWIGQRRQGRRVAQDVKDRILDEIAVGKSLLAICRQNWAPHPTTVMNWKRKDVRFRDAYQFACELRLELLAEEIIALADSSVDHKHTRIMIDARKWLMAKIHARLRSAPYGGGRPEPAGNSTPP